MTALRQLASVLGATLLIEEHDDLVAAAARVVRERGTTYIMVGESLPPRGLARLREPLPQRLMRATPPGVDVRIVAHRGRKEERDVIEHVLVGVALAARPRRRLPDRPLAPARQALRAAATRSTRSCCPSPAPRSRAAPLDAALRLARAEDATLMPAYLAAGAQAACRSSARSPARPARAMPMLEAIEQRATAQGVPVDARIERGRSYRHALERLLEHETVRPGRRPGDRRPARTGLSGDDLVWLLQKAPAEVLILRPAPSDESRLSVTLG